MPFGLQASVEPQRIFSLLCLAITGLSVFGTLVLAIVWFVYFLSRVRELSRKIHYLKEQTDERCCEELTNAKVDHVKSLFIAAISASEIMIIVITSVLFVVQIMAPTENYQIHGCLGPIFVEMVVYFPFYKEMVSLLISLVIVFLSLNHILTLYLSRAYRVMRVIQLTYGARILFLVMLIQIIIVWLSRVERRLFLCTVPILMIVSFSIHLCLYCKYSRRLYQLLKRRRLDAWFEDQDSHGKLDVMCKDYKTGSILYTTCIVLFLIAFSFSSIVTLMKLFLVCPYQLNLFVESTITSIHSLSDVNNFLLNGFLNKILTSLLSAVISSYLFSLHLVVLGKVVRRHLDRRRTYQNINNFNNLFQKNSHQPLIGSA